MECLHKTGKCIVHQLYENPEPRLEVVSFDHFKHTLILLAHSHDSDLVYDDFAFIFVFRLYKFESTKETIRLSFHLENFSEPSLTQFANDIVKFAWVYRLYLAILLNLSLELLLGRHLFNYVGLAIAFGVVHRNQTINNICCALVNVLLGVVY